MKTSRNLARFALFAVATLLLASMLPVVTASPDPLLHLVQAVGAHADAGLLLAVAPLAAVRQLKAKKSDHVKAAQAINDITDRDLTVEEQTALAGHMASIKTLNQQIENAEALANEQAGMDAGGVEIKPGARIETEDNQAADPTRGFRSFGDFARAVANSSLMGSTDRRLTIGAAAPGNTTTNESNGPDGGFLVPPQFSQEIWRLSLEEDSLIPLTENTEVSGNSMIFPKDETTPWGGSGVQAYWQIEAAAATASKLALSTEALVLHKLMCLVPVTNELISDAAAIGSYLNQVAPGRITWKANEAILFGDGVGKPLGCLNSATGPLITVAKESGQVTQTFDPKNLSKMVSRLIAGQLKNAVWIGNPDILPALEALTLGQYPIFLPSQSVEGNSYGMLKGRPLWLSEHANAFSSAGDLNLVSMKGYRCITKAGGIQTDTSMHLYFDADATAFRFIFRLNGKPIMSQPIATPKGNTRSHFVAMGAR